VGLESQRALPIMCPVLRQNCPDPYGQRIEKVTRQWRLNVMVVVGEQIFRDTRVPEMDSYDHFVSRVPGG
jgi:hypothetical protein